MDWYHFWGDLKFLSVFFVIIYQVPHESVLISSLLKDYGHFYVDAPVSGGPKGAVEGTLTSMIGGEVKIVQKVCLTILCIFIELY